MPLFVSEDQDNGKQSITLEIEGSDQPYDIRTPDSGIYDETTNTARSQLSTFTTIISLPSDFDNNPMYANTQEGDGPTQVSSIFIQFIARSICT